MIVHQTTFSPLKQLAVPSQFTLVICGWEVWMLEPPPLSASIRSPLSKAARPCLLLPELLAVRQFIFWQLTTHCQHFASSRGPWYIFFGDGTSFKRRWCALLLLLLFVNPTETCGWRCILWTHWNNACFCVVIIDVATSSSSKHSFVRMRLQWVVETDTVLRTGGWCGRDRCSREYEVWT